MWKPIEINHNRTPIVSRAQFRQAMIEGRALQVDDDTKGGYLVAPGEMLNELSLQEAKVSVLRAYGRVLEPIKGESLPVPSQESELGDGEWVSELIHASEDAAAPFGKRELRPHPLSKRIRASKKLINRSPSNAEAWVLEAIARAIAAPQEEAFINGSGAGEPLGILQDANIPVITDGNVATSIQADGIRNLVFSLPARYRSRAIILTTLDVVKQATGLKDGAGNYIIPPDWNGRWWNMPVVLTDGWPAITFVSGDPVAIIGDFKNYWIVDDEGSTVIQRLNELYAETNEIGYQIHQGTDGMPVNSDAFRILKLP